MSKAKHADAALLPPLLRPEVFAHAGAADWVGTTRMARLFSPAWMVGGSVVGLAALVLAFVTIPHRQNFRTAGQLVPHSLHCVATCEAKLRLSPDAPHPGEALADRPLQVTPVGQPAVQVQMLAPATRGMDASNTWRVSWPLDTPLPAGPVSIVGTKERSLLGWILPRPDTGHRMGATR